MPERWLVRLKQTEETLGQMLRRLRGRLSQIELGTVAGLTDKEANIYPKWERDEMKKPNAALFRKLEVYYGLPQDTLLNLAYRTWAMEGEGKPVLIGDAIAIPDEPGLVEVVTEVLALEDHQLPHAARTLRQFREDVERRTREKQQRKSEADEVAG